MRNLKEQVKNNSVTKNSSDLSLFESIVLVISKNLKTLGLQPRVMVLLGLLGDVHKDNFYLEFKGV